MGALHQSIGALINLRGCYRAPIRPHNSSWPAKAEATSTATKNATNCATPRISVPFLCPKKITGDRRSIQSFDFELRYADDDMQIELIEFL
jgi:hypothetical protein